PFPSWRLNMDTANARDAMNRLKKDWADLGARAQVSEVGLDVDRAELIHRYHEQEKLTQRQIGEVLELSHDRVSHLLRYRRYNVSSTRGRTHISEKRFRAYWQQIADPKLTRGKREPDLEYEALCFADIGKLVEVGTPPQKKGRREKEPTRADITTIRAMRKAVRRLCDQLSEAQSLYCAPCYIPLATGQQAGRIALAPFRPGG